MAEEETTLTAEELQRQQRMLRDLLGDDYDPDESVRSQVRRVLEEQSIRNASSIAAQATDIALMDFVRLFYLQSQFENPASAPQIIQYEMMDLRSRHPDLETATPQEPYNGPTYDITGGPEAVTGEDLAAAYVERFGADLPEGPLDHSDTVVTRADLEDAITKYESIEITPEEIEAYQARSLQQLIDSRMDGVDPSDPDYASRLEAATEWAQEMGMPMDSVALAALRDQRFIEQYPELRLSDEQAATIGANYGSDPGMIQNVGSVLTYYTDTGAAHNMGMHNYKRDRAALLDDLQEQRATEYQNSIADQVAEIQGVGENINALTVTALDSNTGIDRDAFRARQGEMNAAFESGDYNTALNIGNQLTATILADADARQLEILTNNFDDLRASAESAGYTVASPEDLQALLNGEDGAQVKADMMGQRWAAGTDAQNVFTSGEYTATERIRSDALATRSEIDTAAAKFEGVDLTDPDTSALTTAGIVVAESAAAPAVDLRTAATNLIDEYRNTGGARIGPLLETATGDSIDFERLQHTMEMLPDFNAGVKFDLDNPEGLTAALATIETYKTGEIPTPERMGQIENIVDAAFNDDGAVTLDAANAGASIHAQFNQMAANAPSLLSRVFGNHVEVGIPDGYDARVANVPTGPEEQTPTVTTGLAM